MGTGTPVSSGDKITAAKMNLKLETVDLEDLPAGIQPRSEYKLGSDCSGSDGDTNRVLTLSNTSLSSQERVYLDGVRLQKDTQYTVNHLNASSTITFLVKVWDTQKIQVDYFV